jgi:outer membrane protein assembly factor BamE (lipoprotein component of BamABCDE complex)
VAQLQSFDISVYIINLIISIPTFFLLRWALKRVIKTDDLLRKIVTWVGTIFLTPIIYFALCIAIIAYISYYPTKTFDETIWRTDTEKRYEMTEDIIDNKLLIGKTKDQIIKTLGDDYFKYDENRWGYDVGFVPRLFNIDPDVLDIHFKDDKVESVGQHES